MKCEELELIMIDYLDNTLDRAQCEEVELHISSCERCMDEIREFKTIFQSMSATEMEKPEDILKINFYYMLQSEINKMKSGSTLTARKASTRRWTSVTLKVAAGIGLIISGAFIGNIIHQKMTIRDSSIQLDDSQGEDRNKMLMNTLLNEESPGRRIKAINYVEDNPSPDQKVLNALINVLNKDNNVNVRLAAAYTLSKFLDSPVVRDSIVESLGKQTEPVVQVVLMNILTEKMEVKAIEPMKKIISNKNTMEQVKYAAEKSIKVLL